MTLRNFGRIVWISLLGLATIGAWGSASANEVAGPHAPGFDRVGKNVVGVCAVTIKSRLPRRNAFDLAARPKRHVGPWLAVSPS